MLFGDSEKETEKFLLSLLNPSSPLFHIVGKRGLDEILGEDYDFYNKTFEQIEKDIWEKEQ